MALPKQVQDATDARLAALSLPESGVWLTKLRSDALDRVKSAGLPSRRDEYWKYTRPETLVDAAAPKAALFHHDEAPVFDAIDRLKIVFVDGVFDPEASDDLTAEGVSIE